MKTVNITTTRGRHPTQTAHSLHPLSLSTPHFSSATQQAPSAPRTSTNNHQEDEVLCALFCCPPGRPGRGDAVRDGGRQPTRPTRRRAAAPPSHAAGDGRPLGSAHAYPGRGPRARVHAGTHGGYGGSDVNDGRAGDGCERRFFVEILCQRGVGLGPRRKRGSRGRGGLNRSRYVVDVFR